MKSPNPSNLDQWLFHYFEGDLSENEEMMLEDFLLENPQFDPQFEAWGAARMNRVDAEFVNRGALLKPLVSPGLLNRITVLTALGVNAILALFIIAGNKPQVDNFALEANNLEIRSALNAANTTMSTIDYSNDAQSSSVGVEESENKPSSNRVLQTNFGSPYPFQFNNQIFSGVIEEDYVERDYKTSIDNHYNPESTSTDLVNTLETVSLLADHDFAPNPNLEIDTEVLSQSNLPHESNSEVASHSQHNSVASSSSGSSVNNSANESKDKKLTTRSNRFKGGGELLLTNSRDVEYLVPGSMRNQINFGHVASDFSNTIYSNTYLQWPNQSNAMLSNQLGLDVFLPQTNAGVGIQLMYDRYANGTINNLELALTYAPKFFLNRSKNIVLEPALRMKMGGTSVNRAPLTPGSFIEFDRSNAFVYTSAQHEAQVNRSIKQDIGLGFLLNTKWGFIGANADNLIGSRNYALHYGSQHFQERNPVFINAVLGTEYESRNKKFRMSGQMVYQNYGDLNKLWLGSRIKYNSLSLGASVSSAGEPMFSLGWVSRNVSMLYSTDYALSQMTGRKHLSHQLTMRVTLKESRLRKLMLN